jgi:hypothetical protein
MRVGMAGGRQWDFAESLVQGEPLANEWTGDGPLSPWWVCGGDAEALHAALIGYALLPLWDVKASAGALYCRPEDHNTPNLNLVRGEGLTVHPGPRAPVTLVWCSPITGSVTVRARLKDADPGEDDHPDQWRRDGVLYRLRKGKETLAKGSVANGGDEVEATADDVSVARGELVRLSVYPGHCEWWDTTAVDLEIRDAGGRAWDLRTALLSGEKLGNQVGSDPSKAVWWVCEGDAPQFDPAALETAPLPEFVALDGKVRFQGTVGSVGIRKGRISMALGDTGQIRAGKHQLVSDGPAAREENL